MNDLANSDVWLGLVTVWFRSLEIITLTQGDGLCRLNTRRFQAGGSPDCTDERVAAASDLGVDFSTLSKWVSQFRPADISIAPQPDLAKENERLRHENCELREERAILEKTAQFFVSQKPRGSNL